MSTTDTDSPACPGFPTDLPPLVGGVVPHLSLSDAAAAIDFYTRAFGAQELARIPAQDGKRLIHAHLRVNGSSVMMADAFAECGQGLVPPQGFVLHLHVDDVEAWWQRAVAAGAEVVMPLQDMFWGDRYGQIRDPFGVTWSLASPTR